MGCLGCGCLGALGVALGVGVLLLVGVPAAFRGAAALREVHDPTEVAPGRHVEADGLQLHLLEWGPPSGPVVLLVPGTSAWGGTWVEVAEPLAARGYRVVAIDLPPFGYSARPTDDRYGRADQAARILGAIDVLEAHDVVLVGHSFGGGATVEAAMTAAPGQVSSLVLLSPALGLSAADAAAAPLARVPVLREPLVAMTFTLPPFLPVGVRSMMADPADATPARVERYQEPLTVRGTTRAIGAWLPELLAPTPARSLDPQAYRSLTVPTMLVWGGSDHVTPVEQGEHLVALLPAAQLVVLDGVGHLPQLEDVPGVLDALLAPLPPLP